MPLIDGDPDHEKNFQTANSSKKAEFLLVLLSTLCAPTTNKQSTTLVFNGRASREWKYLPSKEDER